MPRAAVIGMGNAGLRHYAAYMESSFISNVLSVERDDGINWRRAIEAVDIVSICTPDNLHCDMTCFALEHGKHVLCEKPLTHRMDELEKIEAAVRVADGQTFGTNFPLRYVTTAAPCTMQPYMIDACYEHGRRNAFVDDWRGSMDGYSLFCGGGIHLVDRIMLGSTIPSRVLRGNVTVNTEGLRAYQIGHFVLGQTLCRVTCNFGFNGEHRVWIRAWTADGPVDLLDQTDEPYDKLADIRQFIADVENGNPGNGADAIRANRICIEMSCTR